MLSSSLLEAFKGSELRFVLGRELGHHLYNHHDIPIGYLLGGKAPPNPKRALALFAWSRYAEISADRDGAHCAKDLEGIGRALFRLTSGLGEDVITFNFDEFITQVDAQPGQGAPNGDWFSTHPFSPLRVKALALFDKSELARPNGTTKDKLEVAVQTVMELMDPDYFDGKTNTAEAMRRLFFAASITVANASDGASEAEIAVFEKFFGDGSFNDKLDIDRLEEELPDRIRQTVEITSPSQRIKLMHDLCLIARADGHVTEAERAVRADIASSLDIAQAFVEQCLECQVELD